MTQEFSRKGAKARRRLSGESFSFAACCLLLAACCLLSSVFSAQTANQSPTPQPATTQASPSPTPASTPTPTPTPPLTLHQWGAVTLFHGLPSDRVRAIAQGPDGAMWFGTDGGLAKYDGRRTQAVTVEGLTSMRVLALKLDEDGALWVGTEDGAGALVNGEFRAIPETAGKVITSIITPERGRAILASEEGVIFDCHVSADNSLSIRTIPEKPLESADFERPGPLNLTSLALKDNVLYVGTRSRGVIAIEAGAVTEIRSVPRPFFVETIEQDAQKHLWFGAKAKAEESGLYEASDTLRPKKIGTGLGMVTALRAGLHDDMWVGTDGRGSFHYDTSDSRLKERRAGFVPITSMQSSLTAKRSSGSARIGASVATTPMHRASKMFLPWRKATSSAHSFKLPLEGFSPARIAGFSSMTPRQPCGYPSKNYLKALSMRLQKTGMVASSSARAAVFIEPRSPRVTAQARHR
jgi:hypothetical protein